MGKEKKGASSNVVLLMCPEYILILYLVVCRTPTTAPTVTAGSSRTNIDVELGIY